MTKNPDMLDFIVGCLDFIFDSPAEKKKEVAFAIGAVIILVAVGYWYFEMV